MSKLIKARIDVKKIIKAKFYVGKVCTYLDIDIWINDTLDKYGNDVSIQQQSGKDEPKLYIGSGKTWKPKEAESGPTAKDEFQGGSANKEAIVNKAKEASENDELSDLPF